MKKSILITGGCGFVGKNITNYLHKQYNITIIDNFSSGNLKFIPSKVKIIKGDIRNKKLLSKVFKKEKFHTVIHCAANFANQSSIDNIYKDTQSNILGTIELLEASKFLKLKNLFIYHHRVFTVPFILKKILSILHTKHLMQFQNFLLNSMLVFTNIIINLTLLYLDCTTFMVNLIIQENIEM